MERPLRLLFVGDVVGPVGCAAATALLPALRRELALDGVIINGENSAPNGFGITEQTAETLLAVADCVTLGDHAFDQPGTAALLDREPRIIRPANFVSAPGGRGWGIFEAAGTRVGVGNLLGHVFMRPEVRPTRAAADELVAALTAAGAQVVIIDMQAEATSEKQALGWHLAGRVAALLGTHTHVPTADLRILPGGTAYVSDVGMTGARDAIIGFARASLQPRPDGAPPQPPLPAEGMARLDAVVLTLDGATGRWLSNASIASGQAPRACSRRDMKGDHMSDDREDFEQFMRQREAAALAYVNGDPELLLRLTVNDDPATFFSPAGDVVQGAETVAARYASGAAAFASANENTLQILDMGAGDAVAYWVGIQRSDVQLQGKAEAVPYRLRVTEIFRREGNAWKLVHRHADPLLQAEA